MALSAKFPPFSLYCPSLSKPKPNPRNFFAQNPSLPLFRTLEVWCGKRTGKRRYPSEKKKLQKLNETLIQTDIKNREEGFWRLSKLGVPVHKDPGKDSFDVSLPLLEAIAKVIEFPYSALAAGVCEGRGKVPVADYKVVKYVNERNNGISSSTEDLNRSCYSFCMCPGGQVVLTSTDPSELCTSGMSFSRCASRWANAALVVNVSSNEFDSFQCHGPLIGVEFQRELERKAATMGRGNFVVPVQTVTDFLDNKLSVTSLPPSRYRLGVQASNLHELLPARITEALQQSITMLDEELPGFITKDALLHGVKFLLQIQELRNFSQWRAIFDGVLVFIRKGYWTSSFDKDELSHSDSTACRHL